VRTLTASLSRVKRRARRFLSYLSPWRTLADPGRSCDRKNDPRRLRLGNAEFSPIGMICQAKKEHRGACIRFCRLSPVRSEVRASSIRARKTPPVLKRMAAND